MDWAGPSQLCFPPFDGNDIPFFQGFFIQQMHLALLIPVLECQQWTLELTLV